MTEEMQDPSAQRQPESNFNPPDWYLEALVEEINGKEIAFPITLFVKGLVISGELVSGHRYFDGLASQLTEFFGGESEQAREVVSYLTSPRGIYLENTSEAETLPPRYIHIRGARIFAPGQQPIPSEGAWWRGRLASVDGFHFGLLTVNKVEHE
jgi:hypothetical protein